MADTPQTVPVPAGVTAEMPDTIAQARADLPKVEQTPPWEDEPRLDLPPTTKVGKTLKAGQDWLEQKVLKPTHEMINQAAEGLTTAGETGHTPSGGQLNPTTRLLLQGAGTLLRWAPVGETAKETAGNLALMAAGGPEAKVSAEERAALRAGTAAAEEAARVPKPKLGPGQDFYSPLEHHVATKLPAKLTGEQLVNTLKNAPGVSKAELEHSGIDTWGVRSRGTITRDEALKLVREQTPHVTTVEHSASAMGPEFATVKAEHATLKENLKRSIVTEVGVSDQQANRLLTSFTSGEPMFGAVREPGSLSAKWTNFTEKHFDELNDFATAKEKLDNWQEEEPKYESYTLPGGKNYREVLLTLPREVPADLKRFNELNAKTGALTPAEEAEYDRLLPEITRQSQDPYAQRAARVESEKDYYGPHFDEPNVVAHLRLKDRVDANGKKTLFIEELQSDWARELREQKAAGGRSLDPERGAGDVAPDMPYDKNWHELALKKALDIAAKGDYDQIAWTTGTQQAERYNLRNSYDSLRLAEENGKLTLSATPAGRGSQGGWPMSWAVTRDNLAQYVGRDHAKNLLEDLDKTPVIGDFVDKETGEYRNKYRTASVDLKNNPVAVGGEHHLRLYDEMTPQFLDRYTKKWGGKVGETQFQVPTKGKIPELGGGELLKTQSLPVTPQMRDAIKEGGQPLFGGGSLDFSSVKGHVPRAEAPGPTLPITKMSAEPLPETPQPKLLTYGATSSGQVFKTLMDPKVQELAQQVGVHRAVITSMPGFRGLNLGKSWYDFTADLIKKHYGAPNMEEGAIQDEMVRYLKGKLGSAGPSPAPGRLTNTQIRTIVEDMAQGKETVLIDEDTKERDTVLHEILHSLTEGETQAIAEKGYVPISAVKELHNVVSKAEGKTRPIASSKAAKEFVMWAQQPHEFITETMTQYFLGNIPKESKLSQLAEATLRHSKNPYVRGLIGTTFGLALMIKEGEGQASAQDKLSGKQPLKIQPIQNKATTGSEEPLYPGDPGYQAPKGVIPSPTSSRKPGAPHDRGFNRPPNTYLQEVPDRNPNKREGFMGQPVQTT